MSEKQRDLHPSVARFIAEHWEELSKPGVFSHLVVEHDPLCRYSQGGDCTCTNGPECKIVKP